MKKIGPTFVSYSFKDRAKFDNVVFALDSAGIDVWNSSEIAAGEPLRDKLRKAIASCTTCVFIATRSSLTSGWCQAELGAFWGAAKPVIVYLEDGDLVGDELPKQFQADKWAATIREVVDSLTRHLTETSLIRDRPANIFWLGHDLARAIRLAKFEPNNWDQLGVNLRQALHHLNQAGVQAPGARKLLLNAIRTHRTLGGLSEHERETFVTALARAKNELGDRIAHQQIGFKGYPSIDEEDQLIKEAED
ncbi:MAG: hypothetical protein QOJ86_3710 [Bradyrhizobium sp.]|nr:hypothetical protein [Bradyrhizobium sp.]